MALDFRGAVKNLKTDIANSGLGRFFSGLKTLFQTIASPENGTSLLNSWTGAHLTGAQQEANQFNAEQAEIQRNWEMNMSNTAYQRQVNDLQAAGINPIMAASNGVSLPTSAAAASVSPSAATFQLSQLLDLYRMKEMLPLEKAAIKAQIRNTEAQANKTDVDTESGKISLRYQDRNMQLEQEGKALANKLSAKDIEVREASIRKAEQEIKESIARTESEKEKPALYIAQRALFNANARRITELLPYEKAVDEARAGAERANAELALVQAAWQKGLIDRGMIEIAVEEAGYKRDSAEYNSAIDRVRSQISGDTPLDSKEDAGSAVGNLIKGLGRMKYFIKQ